LVNAIIWWRVYHHSGMRCAANNHPVWSWPLLISFCGISFNLVMIAIITARLAMRSMGD
jgi:hypothetical protein